LVSELCQTVGDELCFTWHIFLGVGKTHDLPSKIWQTLGDALKMSKENFVHLKSNFANKYLDMGGRSNFSGTNMQSNKKQFCRLLAA
jgi:hypothetical protein